MKPPKAPNNIFSPKVGEKFCIPLNPCLEVMKSKQITLMQFTVDNVPLQIDGNSAVWGTIKSHFCKIFIW